MNYSKKIENTVEQLINDLFPICRSITGNGVRETLLILKNFVDFGIKEIPSGTKCYDWVVPDEWNIQDAYIENTKGRKIIDFKKNNLHVINYSIPVNNTFSYQELDEHLHTLPRIPDAIPYRTSYYKRNWGFCISHKNYQKLEKNQNYHVVIKSTLKKKGT